MFFSATTDDNTPDTTDEQISEEEEEEEEESEEEEEEEEEVEDEAVFDLEEEVERQKRLEFHDKCRSVFIDDWLKQEGDWFSSLKTEHLVFLRDVLNIRSSAGCSPTWFNK